jgi:hypothetical protein
MRGEVPGFGSWVEPKNQVMEGEGSPVAGQLRTAVDPWIDVGVSVRGRMTGIPGEINISPGPSICTFFSLN